MVSDKGTIVPAKLPTASLTSLHSTLQSGALTLTYYVLVAYHGLILLIPSRYVSLSLKRSPAGNLSCCLLRITKPLKVGCVTTDSHCNFLS